MNVARFQPSDLDELDVQDAQAGQIEGVREVAESLASHLAYTARAGSKVVAIAGVVSVSADVGYLWALIGRGAGSHLVRLHKLGARLIQTCGKARLLADTESTFTAGCRWLALLGFEQLEELEGGSLLYRKVCA